MIKSLLSTERLTHIHQLDGQHQATKIVAFIHVV